MRAAAICLHLCDAHPGAGLAPPVGTAERAHFYKWLAYLTNTLQAEILHYAYPERLGGESCADVVRARAEARVGEMLELLDAELARHGGPWLLGERYSACDPYLAMLCRWTRKMARPARDRAHLAPFLQRIAARPAVRRAFEAEGIAPPWF